MIFFFFFFFFNDTATTEIYTLSLHDALPIFFLYVILLMTAFNAMSHGTQDMYQTFLGEQRHYGVTQKAATRSEEHTSELQSQSNLVCRLLLEKKKTQFKKDDVHIDNLPRSTN